MLCDCGNGKETIWNDMCDTCNEHYNDLISSPEDVCDGCMRIAMHKMCPAHGTPFYMTGVPFTEEVERLYNKKKSDEDFDAQKFFLAIREKDGIMKENKEELKAIIKKVQLARMCLSEDSKSDYREVIECDVLLEKVFNDLLEIL